MKQPTFRIAEGVPPKKPRPRKIDWDSVPFDMVPAGSSLVLVPDDPDEITSLVTNARVRAQEVTDTPWSSCVIEGEVWLWQRTQVR